MNPTSIPTPHAPLPTNFTPDILCLQVVLGLQQLFTQALEKAQKEITKDTTNMVLHISRQLGQWFDRQMKLQKTSPRSQTSFSTSKSSPLVPSNLSHPSNSSSSSSQISNLKSSNPDTVSPEKVKEALKKQGHPKEEEKKPLWKELLEKPKDEKDPLHELMNGPGGVLAWAERQAKLSS